MPIAHNPTEMLLQIFHYAVAGSPVEPRSGTKVAFPISQVCQRWRHIALDSPALWDDVRFPRSTTYQRDTLILDEVLARSRTRTLTVVFSYSPPDQGETIDFAPLFNKMIEVCHRFQAIHAILPRFAMLQFSDILGHRIFPLLVHLHIAQNDNLTPVSVTFENAPRLGVLRLENITLCRNKSRSAQLTALFGGIATPVMDSLCDLTITHAPSPIFKHVDGPTIIALKSLTLEKLSKCHYNFRLLEFLTSFHMPHLRYLELSIEDSKSHFSAQLLRALAPPAVYPALRTVKFTGLSLSGITPDFCYAIPALETLVLVDLDPSPLVDLLRADSTLCLALRNFYLDGHLRRR
ncbi:hypothetical protein DFH08DRAFT_235866 [Mycena albidolilacea]|uniref:F-box domain-containing protein n=1 Tax=Mycena albidolilacea TaxID=1033008 RepID=A0AAD6ZX25_9AGAR|nr:hypothetical protein DFH08DRAFT_235866 [Mycena albidolilacea]